MLQAGAPMQIISGTVDKLTNNHKSLFLEKVVFHHLENIGRFV
jgi:hypothetical protein